MTNLEFEKIARGPLARIGNEYIWGTLNITQAQSTAILNEGTTSEVSSTSGNGLAAYGSSANNGPLRVGFSATNTTNRETSGAAYYGVMNLGGNIWEIVTGGKNRSDNGYKLTYANLGNGSLSSSGNHNVANWQTYYSNYWHFELRGGSYSSGASTLKISDRSKNYPYMGFGSNTSDQRLPDVGGRGVR
jgi:hypothetical protein